MSYSLIGPYTITIDKGNEEDRFRIKPNSTEAHELDKNIPPPRPSPNVTLHGEVVILCPNNATDSGSGSFEKTVLTPVDFKIGDVSSGVVTVKNPLDYEKTREYVLMLTIFDEGKGVKGKATVFVSGFHFGSFHSSKFFNILVCKLERCILLFFLSLVLDIPFLRIYPQG